MSERKTIKYLNASQCVVYNDMVNAFMTKYAEYIKDFPKPDQRFGQIFCSYYGGEVFDYEPCPDLWYEKDNTTAGKLMEHYLVTHIMEKYK